MWAEHGFIGFVLRGRVAAGFRAGTDLLAVKPHDAEVWRMLTLGRLRLKSSAQLGNQFLLCYTF